ncbi:MAG: hypothetical protein GEV11_28740 [Streptosporangiales bacterium]|nr:hypothetical protein [Streptosporangiales bacterium]
MIIRLDPSSSGTISWFRTYHVGLLVSDVPSFLMSGTARERLELLDAPRRYFFDIQVLRSGHVARAKYRPRIKITGDYVWWYVEENQALTLSAARTYDAELEAFDPDRTQLLEFLNIRRAAPQSIQRETQRVLADGTKIPRARIEAWHQMVVTTTDDYILNVRIGRLIEPLREHNAEERRVRDLAQLADQVQVNLESFQRRLESAARGSLR